MFDEAKKMSSERLSEAYITKGSRVRARWYAAYETSLSGMQMKTGVRENDVTGTVTYVEGLAKTKEDMERKIAYKTVLGLKLDDGSEIEIDSKHVVEVFQ